MTDSQLGASVDAALPHDERADQIIILGRHGGDETPTLRATWERLQSVPALRTGRVHSVDLSLLHRYGPRVVDGLETLARLIHPEAFR